MATWDPFFEPSCQSIDTISDWEHRHTESLYAAKKIVHKHGTVSLKIGTSWGVQWKHRSKNLKKKLFNPNDGQTKRPHDFVRKKKVGIKQNQKLMWNQIFRSPSWTAIVYAIEMIVKTRFRINIDW